MYTHYRGTTFQFVGQFQNDGDVQDLTGCSLAANVYNKKGDNLYGQLTVTIIAAASGIVQLSFPDTSAWSVGVARIDCLLTLLDGTTVASDPDYFRVAETPMV